MTTLTDRERDLACQGLALLYDVLATRVLDLHQRDAPFAELAAARVARNEVDKLITRLSQE